MVFRSFLRAMGDFYTIRDPCAIWENWASGLALRLSEYMLIKTMPDRIQTIRDSILKQALPSVAFDGWTAKLLEQAAIDAGHEASMVRAVFPEGIASALDHFA